MMSIDLANIKNAIHWSTKPVPSVLINPTETQLASLKNEYQVRMWNRLSKLIESGVNDLNSLFYRMKGAWPGDIVDILYEHQALPIRFNYDSLMKSNTVSCSPELHPLSYEWYFTTDTSQAIGRNLISQKETTLCFGTPTIVAALPNSSSRIFLFDSSPYLSQRFQSRIKPCNIYNGDVSRAERSGITADCVIFDAPWNLPDLLSWFSIALGTVRLGGRIIFSLYPPFVRPLATLERDFILSLASAVGHVEHLPDILQYETPLFEREALSHRQLDQIGDWRHGDLVSIKVTRKVNFQGSYFVSRTTTEKKWKDILVGSQVIKIRKKRLGFDKNNLLISFGDLLDYRYPSVSYRDRLRPEIGIWTSRNRVGRVGNPDILISIFDRIAKGVNVRAAIETTASSVPNPAGLEAEIYKILSIH